MTAPLHIVYISQLAPGRDYSVFADICRGARVHNAAHRIGGVLLFDGQRFCQWLCGAPDEVSRLMQAIRADARHTQVSVRFEAALPGREVEPHWRSGFIDADALDAFAELDSLDGGTVMKALLGLLDRADLEPPVAWAD